MDQIEFADILIWGGLTVIVLRFALPRLLEFLGLPITKKPRDRDDHDA